MPDRVKCLHVLVAHSLARGPGVNPLGDEALEQLDDWWEPTSAAAASRRRMGESDRLVRVGAVDCGTNSIRLLVADVDRTTGALTDVLRRMEIVRSGTASTAPAGSTRSPWSARSRCRASTPTSAPP